MSDPLDDMDLNETTKDILRAIKREVEGAYLDRIRELEGQVAHLKGEREQGEEGRASSHFEIDGVKKHVVGLSFEVSDRKATTPICAELLRANARYVQWLEDELWRYQGVPDEMYAEWDEQAVRDLAEGKPKMHPEEDAQELAKALQLTLKVLDANRQWTVRASEETTRIGHEVLKLREDEAHWREHVRQVDYILGQCLIPVRDDDGNRIFTEDRLVRLIKLLTGRVSDAEVLGMIPDVYRGTGDEVVPG